jgi:4-amino-4-deoxy-L-arabinose transferase-like glycosyltransferase
VGFAQLAAGRPVFDLDGILMASTYCVYDLVVWRRDRLARSSAASDLPNADLISNGPGGGTGLPTRVQNWSLTPTIRGRGNVLAVFSAALAVRLLFCFVIVPAFGLPLGPRTAEFFTSADGYIGLGVTLAEHGRLAFHPGAPPTIFRGPAYPAAIALAYLATRHAGVAVLLVNALASAAACAILYVLARRLLSEHAGVWMATALVAFPLSAYYTVHSFADTFLTLGIALYLLATLALLQAPSLRAGVTAGVAFAIAALTKTVVLPFAPLFVLYVAWRRRAALGAAALAALVGLGAMGAWGARGYLVSGHFSLPTVGVGFNALLGNFAVDLPGSPEAFSEAKVRTFERVRRDHGVAVTTADIRPADYYDIPPALDRLFGASAMRMFREDPGLLVRKMAIGAWRFWFLSSTPWRSAANLIVNYAVIVLAALTLWRLRGHHPVETDWLAIFVVVYVAIYAAIFVGSSRYCLPVALPLAPFAAGAVLRGSSRFTGAPATS